MTDEKTGKPATKPAAKKPAGKPAAKKPTTKPAAKKPATKPVAKKPAAEASVVPPLPDLGRADGPWSFEEAPADQAFVSFGPLKVPAFPTLHVNLQIDAKTKRPGAVAIGMEGGSIQLQVFAAPRGGGLWGDLRRAMARKVVLERGAAQAVEGDFGPELVVNRPLANGGRLVGNLTSRVVGIEGDRWLLRAVVGGKRSLTDDSVARVNNFLSHCAVERGDDPYTPGTIVPLAFPVGGRPVETTEVAGESLETNEAPEEPGADA